MEEKLEITIDYPKGRKPMSQPTYELRYEIRQVTGENGEITFSIFDRQTDIIIADCGKSVGFTSVTWRALEVRAFANWLG